MTTRRNLRRHALHSATISALIPALFAAGCVQPPERPDESALESSAAALSSAGDLQALADRVAFDADYVAYQLAAIDLFARVLPHGAALRGTDLSTIAALTPDELRAETGVTDADVARLRTLAARVRARFPWTASQGMDFHRLAICTNPRLYSAFEASLRAVPDLFRAVSTPGDPAARRGAAHGVALARVSGGTSSASADSGPPGADAGPGEELPSPWLAYGIMTTLLVIAIVSFATGHPEVVGIILLAFVIAVIVTFLVLAVIYIVEWVIEAVSDIIQWVEDLPETLDEAFGHDDDECSDDSECDPDEYCDNGDVLWGIFGTNTCKPDHELGEGCWHHSECESNCCKVHWFELQCRPADKCD